MCPMTQMRFMRSMMIISKKFASIIVLLSITSHCLNVIGSCEAGGTDPFSMLDDYLTKREKSTDFRANIRTLGEFVRDGIFLRSGDRKLKLLTIKVSQLNLDSVCSASNIDTLKRIIEDTLEWNKKAFKGVNAERRLSRIIVEPLREANCYEQLEQAWTSKRSERRQNAFEAKLGVKLGAFDRLNRDYAKIGSVRPDELDLQEFSGAMRRKDKEIFKKLTGKELISMISEIHLNKAKSNQLKVNADTDKPERLDKLEAAAYLEAYLLKPCAELIKSDEVRDILKPVVDLGTIYSLDKTLDPQSSRPARAKISLRQKVHIFRWAARYIMCEQLARMDRASLVEDMVKAHKI